MPELGDATLQVSYKGAEITGQILEKLFAAILREIEANKTSETEKAKTLNTKSITKEHINPQSKHVITSPISRATTELKDEGVLFQVLKQPGQEPEYTLIFMGKDLSTIEKALKSLNGDRTLEKTPEHAEPGQREQGFCEHALAADAKDKAELLDNTGALNIIDRLQPKAQDQSKPRIFTGKNLQDDIRIAREAVTKRNAERAATRTPKAPERGHGR